MPVGRDCWFLAACWEEAGEEHTWALGWEEGMRFQDLLRGLSRDKVPAGEPEAQVVGLGLNLKMQDS